MRAARFHEWGAPPVLDEIPAPVRAEGEVLVEVRAGAVAHLDVTVAGGDFGLRPALPYVGGVEGAGIVLEADPDSGLAPGAPVMLRGGGIGLRRDGTWTERVSVPLPAVTPVPAGLSPQVAATFFVPATTAYVALHDVARLVGGEDVVVVGAAGAVGSMVAQLAVAAGASVIGVVGRAERVAEVPAGVEPMLLRETDDLATARSAALLVDTIGGAGLIERTRWVRPGGRAVVIGYTAGARTRVELPSWLLDDVALLPVNMIRRERRAREVAGELVARLAVGELTLAVEQFDLAEAALALERLGAGHIRGRAVVTPNGRLP